MPFRHSRREFFMNVAEGRCLWVEYSEEKGFHFCGRNARHVHHIIPESLSLRLGEDPEKTMGLPVCEDHHVRNFGDEPFGQHSSFHPEMAYAYRQYREWKGQAQHLRDVMGRVSINYSDSPFADVQREYQKRISDGERICTGDEATDQFYIELMEEQISGWVARNGTVKSNSGKPHKDYNPQKKKRWYDGLFN